MKTALCQPAKNANREVQILPRKQGMLSDRENSLLDCLLFVVSPAVQGELVRVHFF
jgi:hypothetical protein